MPNLCSFLCQWGDVTLLTRVIAFPRTPHPPKDELSYSLQGLPTTVQLLQKLPSKPSSCLSLHSRHNLAHSQNTLPFSPGAPATSLRSQKPMPDKAGIRRGLGPKVILEISKSQGPCQPLLETFWKEQQLQSQFQPCLFHRNPGACQSTSPSPAVWLNGCQDKTWLS